MTSPGVYVHQQHQSLHCNNVYPFAMKSRHFKYFEVCDTQHYKRQEKGEGVEKHGEDNKLRPTARPRVGQCAGRVKPVVSHPGEASGHRGEGYGVRPRVAEHERCVFVAHFGVVPQGEHHRDPPVNAESCHAQHRVGGQEGLHEAHGLTEDVPSRLSLADKSHQSQRHVRHGQQQVAEGEVEVEESRDLLADLRVVQKADQHQDVGQQRHDNDHDHQRGQNYLHSVHPVRPETHLSPLFVCMPTSCSCHRETPLITHNRGHASRGRSSALLPTAPRLLPTAEMIRGISQDKKTPQSRYLFPVSLESKAAPVQKLFYFATALLSSGDALFEGITHPRTLRSVRASWCRGGGGGGESKRGGIFL